MKNITREGDANKYYMYKGIFVTRDRHTGYYSAYTASGRIMANTQREIKKLINETTASAYHGTAGRMKGERTMKLKWEKIDAQLRISTDGRYAIAGRYTYYQGWTPYFLPDGKEGEWIALDGMHAGRGALEICRQICDEHNQKHNNI